MKIAIVQFPGSNCERETATAVQRAGMTPVNFLWNESPEKLFECDGFVIVGGFSYEDRGRAGVIAALDPVMAILRQQGELGKPILGICNGAQILVETGLVPGLQDYSVAMALTENWRVKNNQVIGTGFFNEWVNIRPAKNYQLNAFTRCITSETILRIPIAHGEGRFLIPVGLLAEMQSQGMIVFQYCDEQGEIVDEFPINPNGSVVNAAAVTNRAGNVMAIMPHPERTPVGDPLFLSMREYIAKGCVQKIRPLYYQPRYAEIKKYALPQFHRELIIGLLVTDNQAISVQNALLKKNIPAKVKRYVHWEIDCNSLDFEKIKTSDVLFNPRKERVLDSGKTEKGLCFLVRAKEDLHGLEQRNNLLEHYTIQSLRNMHHGVLWHIDVDPVFRNDILNSHILFNPVAHDCYEFTLR